MITAGTLNVRITVKQFATTQDGATGELTVTAESWDKWANVRENSDNRILDSFAIRYTSSYTVTMRYEDSRPTLNNYQLEYEGARLVIHSIVRKEEGKKRFEIIQAYTTT